MLSYSPKNMSLEEMRDRVDLSSKQDQEKNEFMKMVWKQDQEKNEFMKALIKMLWDYDTEMRGLQSKLAHQAENYRMMYQEEINGLQAENARLSMLIKNPYVVVLIDGDGALFDESFLDNPALGAVEAAQKLKKHVRDHLEQSSSFDNNDVSIFTRMFTSLRGLASAMRTAGVIEAEDKMLEFAEHFTNSCPEFDMINVGRGKENADSKIRTMLRHFMKDPGCLKIYFVACHDSGYVHDLQPFVNGNSTEERIVLVETTPAHEKIKALNLPLTQFSNVFRNKPLPKSVSSSPRLQQSPTAAVPRAPQLTTSGNGGISINHSPSYANAGGKDDHQNLVIKTSATWPPAKTMAFNKDGCRLDPPLKPPSMNSPAQVSYKQKSEVSTKAFCNAHYLAGKCPWKQNCDKEHNVKLDKDEIVIHRFRARMAVCYSGPRCDDAECIHGHHCPQSPHCSRSSCKWRNTVYGDLHHDKAEMQPAS